MSSSDRSLSIVVSEEELAVLRRFDFPCSEGVLASARSTESGIELTGSRLDFDDLAGWVAGEANYQRRKRRSRQTRLLDSIADQLEDVLAAHIRWHR
jgi:hypothetical protein